MTEHGWSALLSGRNALRSAALAGGVALHAINVYMVVTILPSLVHDIGGEKYYAWAATVFIVASLVSASFSIRLLQWAGPRLAYTYAALLFGCGTLIAASAMTMPFFLLGRTVQGLGGGLLLSLSYSMVRIIFPAPLWPRALAVISGMWGIATLLGPAVGGLFAEYAIWRAAFWLVAALSLFFAIFSLKILPKKNTNNTQKTSLPLPQITSLCLSVLFISIGSAFETLSGQIISLLGGVALLGLLVWQESTSKNRMLPKRALFPKSPLFPLYILVFLLPIATNGSELFLPLFLQQLHNCGPLTAGYLASLLSIGWTLGTLISAGAQLSTIRFILKSVPLISAGAMATLFIMIPIPSSTNSVLIIISLALVVTGFAIGSIWPHLLARILQCAGSHDAERASASLTTTMLFTVALSAAISGLIANFSGLVTPGGVEGTSKAASALFAFYTLLFATLCTFYAVLVARSMEREQRRQQRKMLDPKQD